MKQAILILLNNAVDVSPDDVRMSGTWESGMLRPAIVDRGSGMPRIELPLAALRIA